MGEIQKTPTNGANLPATLTHRENQVMGALVVFNQLRAYKMDLAESEGWRHTILRLRPDIEIEQLRLAIDGMIDGRIDYDEKKGIKNIFSALRFVGKNERGEWVIFKPVF
jgi:hypothetical protein